MVVFMVAAVKYNNHAAAFINIFSTNKINEQKSLRLIDDVFEIYFDYNINYRVSILSDNCPITIL